MNIKPNIAISYTEPSLQADAMQLAAQYNLPCQYPYDDSLDYVLLLSPSHLALHTMQSLKLKPIIIDFLAGKNRHRQLQGGGRHELIVRACGIKTDMQPTLIDATAGFGQDAFVLANAGAKVLMIERSPIIAALLQDALKRLQQAASLSLNLVHQNAIEFLKQLPADQQPDIIYLDPMHPTRQKSALVKKEMRIIRDIVGHDQDAQALLTIARQRAKKRVVVKRPKLAETIGNHPVSHQLTSKTIRFDVYLL